MIFLTAWKDILHVHVDLQILSRHRQFVTLVPCRGDWLFKLAKVAVCSLDASLVRRAPDLLCEMRFGESVS